MARGKKSKVLRNRRMKALERARLTFFDAGRGGGRTITVLKAIRL